MPAVNKNFTLEGYYLGAIAYFSINRTSDTAQISGKSPLERKAKPLCPML